MKVGKGKNSWVSLVFESQGFLGANLEPQGLTGSPLVLPWQVIACQTRCDQFF
jgi:hypothetical protein